MSGATRFIGNLLSPPSQPQQMMQPEPEIFEEDDLLSDDVEERDVEAIDRARRRKARPSLLQLLQQDSDSPTLL